MDNLYSFFILAVLVVSFVKCNYNVAITENVNNSIEKHGERQGKFWGVGIVRFANSICKAADGSDGTCYTRRQCRDDVNGIASGRCAANIGVCCVVQTTCGESSSHNNTYFSNPNFPNPYYGSSTCVLTIKKCNSDICQVRIDFLYLNLAQPSLAGVCTTDSLNVVGGASIIAPICGENSGGHMYVDFNGESDIRLIINTGVNPAISRNWRLKIAQIGCDCATRAPSGCLQYYTGLSGTVNSFNYGTTANAIGTVGTRQIASTNYGVCVAMQPGYCSITWTQAAGDPYSFSVSGDTVADIAVPPVTPTVGAACTTDFVIIPNSATIVAGVPVINDRYCGNVFLAATTSSKPFVLTVVTDANEMNDNGNRGFSLLYTQNRCSNSMLVF